MRDDPPTPTRSTEEPRTLEWPIYTHATMAALAILVPIPLLDAFFERLFRNRMPRAIAAYRSRKLDREVVARLNHSGFSLSGCLLFPLWLLLLFLKRLYRTLLYFLTVKEATDKLNLYWHRAFLIDLAVRRRHLERPEMVPRAIETIETLLAEADRSPMLGVARQVVGGARHVLQGLFRSRRGIENEAERAARDRLGRSWGDLRGYLDQLTARYDAALAEKRLTSPPPST